MPARHISLGRKGERAAADYLRGLGCVILDTNWRHGRLELDIVCRDGDTLVFVEVKTRKAGTLTAPSDGMTAAKQRALSKAASIYLSENDAWDEPCRFDLAAVIEGNGELSIEHTKDVVCLDREPAGRCDAPWQPW